MAKREMPGQRGIMIFFIITMLIGGGLIPGYLLMRDLKLLNTFWVYIVPAFGNTYNMLIVKLFVENIPKDIIESADLDGASEIQKIAQNRRAAPGAHAVRALPVRRGGPLE